MSSEQYFPVKGYGYVFGSGKYKGKTVQYVLDKADFKFLLWCHEQGKIVFKQEIIDTIRQMRKDVLSKYNKLLGPHVITEASALDAVIRTAIRCHPNWEKLNYKQQASILKPILEHAGLLEVYNAAY